VQQEEAAEEQKSSKNKSGHKHKHQHSSKGKAKKVREDELTQFATLAQKSSEND
jgi:hypothetical protein